jgi:hypothetical protein
MSRATAATLISRNGHVFKSWPQLAEEIAHSVGAHSAILDGEICCLDADGRSNFKNLLFRREWPFFVAFDLLSVDGCVSVSNQMVGVGGEQTFEPLPVLGGGGVFDIPGSDAQLRQLAGLGESHPANGSRRVVVGNGGAESLRFAEHPGKRLCVGQLGEFCRRKADLSGVPPQARQCQRTNDINHLAAPDDGS